MTVAAVPAIDTMRFHQEGWLGPFELYGPERADDMRAMCDDVIYRGWRNDKQDHLDPAAHVHNRHLRDRRLLELARSEPLVERVCALIGDDALIWRTHFWSKIPGAKAIPWHQDYNYWPLEPAVIVTAWVAIDRSTRANGCLNLIPGSHRTLLPHLKIDDGSAFDQQADPALVPRERAIPVELEPGQFILFNERTLHQSAANASPHRRLGFAVRIIASLTRVLGYDSDDHVLHPLRQAGALRFNRLA